MIQLAYRSDALRPELALVTLAEILAVSQRHDAASDVTAALLVSRVRFFQMLEGRPAEFDRTLRRIASDHRHRNIEEVLRVETAGRLFPGWSMVAARVSPAAAEGIGAVIDHCAKDPQAAVAAVRALVDKEPRG